MPSKHRSKLRIAVWKERVEATERAVACLDARNFALGCRMLRRIARRVPWRVLPAARRRSACLAARRLAGDLWLVDAITRDEQADDYENAAAPDG